MDDKTNESCKDMPPVKSDTGQSRAADALVAQIKNKRKAAAEKEKKAAELKLGGKKGNNKNKKRGGQRKPSTESYSSFGESAATTARGAHSRCQCLLCLLEQWITAEPTSAANCMDSGLDDWAYSCGACGGLDGISDTLVGLLMGPLFTAGAKLGAKSMDKAIMITNDMVPRNGPSNPYHPQSGPAQHNPQQPSQNGPAQQTNSNLPHTSQQIDGTAPGKQVPGAGNSTGGNSTEGWSEQPGAAGAEPESEAEQTILIANKKYDSTQYSDSASTTYLTAVDGPLTVPEKKKLQKRSQEKYTGSWMPQQAVTVDERELPMVPAFGKEPNIKRVHRTLQFVCVCKDGHSTHCFFYNEKEGLRGGGVCQCMFSTERVSLPSELEKQEQIPPVETEQQRSMNTAPLPESRFAAECPSPTPIRPSVFHGSQQAVPKSPPLSRVGAVTLRRFSRSQSPIF